MQPSCRVRYDMCDYLGTPTPHSLEHFLVERYRLHVQRGPTLWTLQVAHAPYPLHRARVDVLADQLVPAAGIQVRGVPPLVHFSPGVNVAVYPPRVRLRGVH
jgi:uncharacterized protein